MANNNFGDRFGRAMSIARANIDPQYMLGAALGAGIRSLYDGYQERGKTKKAKEIYDSMPVANQDTQQGSSQGLSDMAILKDPADLLKSYGVELPEGMTADDVVASRDSFGVSQGATVQPSPGLLNNQASIIASNMAQSAKPAEAQAAQAAQGLLAQQRQMGDQTNQQLNQVVQEEEARKAQALQNTIKLGTMFATGGANAGAEAAAGEAVAEQAGEEAIKKAAEEATTDAMKNMGVSSMQQYALDNNPYKKRSFTQGATQTQPSFEEAPELLPNLTNAERRGMNEIVQLKRSYQYFKDMYDNAEDDETAQKAQEGMAAVMKQANNLRNNYAKAGVNLDRLAGSQATLEDVTNRIQQDGIRKYNELTSGDNFMSSDQFYYKMFDRLREKGMSPEDAERFAKQYASRYQANLIARQSNALRDIGIDGSTINQVGAMLIANMAKENPNYANAVAKMYASPKETWGLQKQIEAANHRQQLQIEAANHRQQLQKELAQWRYENGYVGRGGSGGGTKKEKEPNKSDLELVQSIENAMQLTENKLQADPTQESRDAAANALDSMKKRVDDAFDKGKMDYETYQMLYERFQEYDNVFNDKFKDFARAPEAL